MDDHAELLHGIQAKDPDSARAAMQQHIVHSGELLAAHFDERGRRRRKGCGED